MAFLGDEGRDALVVKRILIDHKFTLLGPITSVGLMHLGPMYYYFMVPFLALSRLDPVGPAIMVALFSLATILLIWKMCTEYFNTRVAGIASLLYATSPIVIIHSHSSWNPNILPFWGLLFMYCLTKVVVEQKPKWYLFCGLVFGITLQLHYVALVYKPITIMVLIWNRVKLRLKTCAMFFAGTVITLSPFILFELRNKFVNTLSVFHFITRTGDAKTFDIFTVFDRLWDLSVRLFWRIVIIENAEISKVFLLFTVVSIAILLWKKHNQEATMKPLLVLVSWFLGGIGVLSFYTGAIYDYYLMFVFPLPFIFTALSFDSLAKLRFGKLVTLVVLLCILYFELKVTPISQPPNRLVKQTRDISEFVLSQSENQPYNFALIADKNSDHAYRYFLEIEGHPPIIIQNPEIDPQRNSVTQQLLIVCEEKTCKPLGHPLWEIAGYGRAEITGEWQVGVVKVFKLIPYPGI